MQRQQQRTRGRSLARTKHLPNNKQQQQRQRQPHQDNPSQQANWPQCSDSPSTTKLVTSLCRSPAVVASTGWGHNLPAQLPQSAAGGQATQPPQPQQPAAADGAQAAAGQANVRVQLSKQTRTKEGVRATHLPPHSRSKATGEGTTQEQPARPRHHPTCSHQGGPASGGHRQRPTVGRSRRRQQQPPPRGTQADFTYRQEQRGCRG